MASTERQLQLCLNKVENGLIKMVFNFLKPKLFVCVNDGSLALVSCLTGGYKFALVLQCVGLVIFSLCMLFLLSLSSQVSASNWSVF